MFFELRKKTNLVFLSFYGSYVFLIEKNTILRKTFFFATLGSHTLRLEDILSNFQWIKLGVGVD